MVRFAGCITFKSIMHLRTKSKLNQSGGIVAFGRWGEAHVSDETFPVRESISAKQVKSEAPPLRGQGAKNCYGY